jgi:hypothetical protein
MCETAANLVECVLPQTALRQWVLTFPFAWRKRLAYDGKLLGTLTRIFVESVLKFYSKRLAREGAPEGQSGAVVVVQRTSSDMKCNPHLHVVFLDGVFREVGGEVPFRELPRLSSTEVGDVLAHATGRMAKHLRRKGLVEEQDEELGMDNELAALTASAVSGVSPPAGPEFRRGALPLSHVSITFDKPLCAALDGFTLHAATRAGALDLEGREALLKYILRPAVAQERVTHAPGGLVRITLKRPFSDGTVAVDMDPLSLLCRLAAAVPPPRFHTVRYAGVLAPASKLRPRIVPGQQTPEQGDAGPADVVDKPLRKGSRYRPWAELLKRTFDQPTNCSRRSAGDQPRPDHAC